MKTKSLIVLCALALAMGNLTLSRAGDDNALVAVADVVLVRPGCFIATLCGSAVFVVALPFAAMSHSIRETAETLVVTPAQATFTRPVGDFSTLY
jgi:hypothetical protein